MDIKELKVGQTVYIKLTGNARRRKNESELIEEWEITYVGRKLVKANRKGSPSCCEETFEKRGDAYNARFVQKTDTCVNYIMYDTKEEIEEEMEHNRLLDEISAYFRNYDKRELSLDALRKITELIKER